jgi:hypothetical protein
MQIETFVPLPTLETALLPSTRVDDACECVELCNCPPTMTRSQAMAYCETQMLQSAVGSAGHAMYDRLLKKGQLFQAKAALLLAQTNFRETLRGEHRN